MKRISLFLLFFISVSSLFAMDVDIDPMGENASDNMGLGSSAGDDDPVTDLQRRIGLMRRQAVDLGHTIDAQNARADQVKVSPSEPITMQGQYGDASTTVANTGVSANQAASTAATTASRGLDLTAQLNDDGTVSFKGDYKKHKRGWFTYRYDHDYDEMKALEDARGSLVKDYFAQEFQDSKDSNEMGQHLARIQ